MAEITLWFTKSETGAVQLERTAFTGNPDTLEIVAVRGKTAGAYGKVGTFQWTPGVKALSLIFLNALARHLKQTTTCLPLLEGERHSLAASLDFALNKQPEWLFDMFGSDSNGNSYLRQLILRSNSGRRRKGPVSLALNENLLSAESIKVYVDSYSIQNVDNLQRLSWTIGKSEVTVGQHSVIVSGIRTGDAKIEDTTQIIMPVTNKDIDDIFEYEEEEFPGSHATKDRLLEWAHHDPSSFMCIKDNDGAFMAYYILFSMKPAALKLFLSGELLEDDVTPVDLIDPDLANYAKQTALHVCCFAARWHASMFTVDLLWHLIGRILNLAVTGSLSTIYAEAATEHGQAFLSRFGFKRVYPDREQGDPLFELHLTPMLLREWERRYKLRTFCRTIDVPSGLVPRSAVATVLAKCV